MADRRTFREVVIWPLLVLFLEALILPLMASPAQASYPTCTTPTFGNGFDGFVYDNSSLGLQGSKASIQYRIPALCGGTSNNVTAWSMLASGISGNGGDGYSQIGYWTQNTGVPHRYFWQWAKNLENNDAYCPPSPSKPPCFHTALWGAPSAADFHSFVVQREASDGGKVHVLLDGVDGPDNADGVLSKTYFDPLLNGNWATPLESQWFGEIHYYESDFPGTTYRTNFNSLQEMNSAGNWVGTNGFGTGWTGVQTTCFAMQADSSSGGNTNFQIWTDPVTRTHSGNNCT